MKLSIFLLLHLATLTIAAQSAVVETASADTAVRWTDSQGREFYGTKPPATAKKVEKLKPKNFSRYSPSKALAKEFARAQSVKVAAVNNTTANVSQVKPVTTEPQRGRLKSEKIRDNDLETVEQIRAGETPTAIEEKVELKAEGVDVKRSPEGEIISCRTTLNNLSMVDVNGVQVSFEFADGTLVPAEGPVRLNAKQGAIYSVPQENLPINLRSGTAAQPQVLINSDAD